MRNLFFELWQGFLELIYPSNIYCICCGNLIDESRPYALCDYCINILNWANKRTCDKCGKILRDGYDLDLCTDCISYERYFEKGYTCLMYGVNERDMIHRFKYKEQPHLGAKMASIMKDRIECESLTPDVIIPVPMFKNKETIRGYNQAEILARELSKKIDVPLLRKILIRKAETTAMSSLNAEERRMNLVDAFEISSKRVKLIKNKDVLLIDDIFTTGSTVDYCAKVLIENGAQRVNVLTFAAGADIRKNGEEEL